MRLISIMAAAAIAAAPFAATAQDEKPVQDTAKGVVKRHW